MTVSTPNLFLIYVTDVARATRFYSELFGMSPQMTTPRYVPFEVAPGVLFALWSGRAGEVTVEGGTKLPVQHIGTIEKFYH